MNEPFDPYRKWLGIPPEEQPPNHYRLLGVPLFENDAETISNAADQRMGYVRTLAGGHYADLTQRVLNELAAARVCLLNPDKKAGYDTQLRGRQAAQAPPVGPSQRPLIAPPLRPILVPSSPLHGEPDPRATAGQRPAGAMPSSLPIVQGLRPAFGNAPERLPTLALVPGRSRKWLPLTAIAGIGAVSVLATFGVINAFRKPEGARVSKGGALRENHPPNVEIVSVDPRAPQVGGLLTIRLTGHDPEDDAIGFEYRTRGDRAWQIAPDGLVSLEQLENGPLTLEFRARDSADRISKVVTRTLEVKPAVPPRENRPPSVEIVSVDPETPEAGGSLTIRLAARDPEDDTIEFEYRTRGDGDWQIAPNGHVSLARLETGPLTLEFRARDGPGVISKVVMRTLEVKPTVPPPENRPPSVEIVSVDPEVPETGGSLTIRLAARDADNNAIEFEYRTRGDGDWQIAPDGHVSLTQLEPGPLTLEFRARDSSGRISKVVTRALDVKATVLTAPTIGLIWEGRKIGSKDAALNRYGGSKESELAVVQGLQWLAKQQKKDGSWSLKGPYSSPAVEPRDIPEAATAMALLAFQGHGSTHQSGPFQKTVARGKKALLEFQQKDGNFFKQDAGRPHNWLYTHAQCTIAICELYGMTGDISLRKPAELAVRFCVESQDPDLGGWRYSPRIDSDTSVTGWMVIALQSAKMAGLEVPGTTWAKVTEYLDKATSDGSHYGYQSGTGPTVSMTAEALLCRQFLGWRQDDPRLVEGAEFLLKHLPSWDDRDVYYWYYATQTMHHMEGKYWTAWNAAFRDMLIEHRETKGQEKGSWDPLGSHPDRWASLGQGGRLYVTCLSLYMLEVYYRHLPIYEMRKMGAK